MDFLSIAKSFGPVASVVAFFLWRDFLREDRMATRINQLEDELRNVVMPLVKETSAVIARATSVLERIEPLLEHHRK